MTISGHELMLLITALSLCASLGVAGAAATLVARLVRRWTAKRSEMALAVLSPAVRAV